MKKGNDDAVHIDRHKPPDLPLRPKSTEQNQSERVLEQLELTRSGRLSVQTLAEFFSVATRKLSPSLTPAEALEQVNLFIRLWPVFDLTPMIVMEAGRGVRDHKLSYYDAQVWATARLNQVPVVFSEDFRSGSILEGVRFVNPFSPEFLLEKWLQSSISHTRCLKRNSSLPANYRNQPGHKDCSMKLWDVGENVT